MEIKIVEIGKIYKVLKEKTKQYKLLLRMLI